ncbi:hypothetical protein Scel_82330 [Streptomyces cellostaticus]|nr:hypothetical protein Scel_82330 [Streptomyces cellostaticus]
MGDTDPFVCLRCLPVSPCSKSPPEGVASPAYAHPARPPGCTLGNAPITYSSDTTSSDTWSSDAESSDRVGVALSYLTPDAQWHTIWRTLANRGE